MLRTLLYFSFVYPFEFRLLVGLLVLRTLLYWAVVLPSFESCQYIGHARLDRASMLLCVKYRYLYLSAHCDTASLIKKNPDSLLKGACLC